VSEQTQQADDPSGPGWRDVGPRERIEQGDVYICSGVGWLESDAIGRLPSEFPNLRYRRRIEPEQPSDTEPETMEDLRRRLAECEVLLAEAERGGEQVNAELQQLREQVLALTLERDRYQSWLQQHHTTGQQSAVKKLERWLRPVVKVVSDHPDHSSILAVSVMEFLPQIASRLIEE
jgi:hypothetical protein